MRCTQCSKKLKPVVALDIDGTLGDYHGHFTRFVESYFNLEEIYEAWDGSGEFSDFLNLTKPEYRQAKLAYRQGGMKRTMPMFPGAGIFTGQLRQIGVEVWITTTRPWLRLDAVDPDTREWLSRNGIHFDYLIYGADKLYQLSQQVEKHRVIAVLDDLVEHYDEAQALFGWNTAILRSNPANEATRGQRHTLREWSTILSTIQGRAIQWREDNK